jgi:hypothetical protein
LQTSPDEREAFVQEKGKADDEEASIEIERHCSIQDSRKFYKRLNDVRRPFEPQVAMCRAKKGELLTNKNWRDGKNILKDTQTKATEQPTRPVDLRDDEVDMICRAVRQ